MFDFPKEALLQGTQIGEMQKSTRIVPRQEVQMGTQGGQHYFSAMFVKLHTADEEGRTPYGVCVQSVKLCHEDCEVGVKLFQMYLQAGKRNVRIRQCRILTFHSFEDRSRRARAAPGRGSICLTGWRVRASGAGERRLRGTWDRNRWVYTMMRRYLWA